MSECSICLDKINKDSIFLDCNHSYHYECINTWIKIKPICPLCRKILICKFRIYYKKYFFLKKYKILEINNNTVNIYNINTKNKLIVNPTFNNNINNNTSNNIFDNNIFDNNILKKNEYLGELLESFEINNIKIIKYNYKYKNFSFIFKSMKNYIFFSKRNNLLLIFNILKQKIQTIQNIY